MYYIIIGVVVIIAFIFLVGISYYNKFQFAIIKIEEAEVNTNIYLEKKLELLKRMQPVIKSQLHKKKYLEEINDDVSNLNHFQLNDKLFEINSKIFKTLDDNEKLLKSEKIISFLDELDDIEDDLIGSIKFYNDTVVNFNKLIVSFPSNIFRLFFGYKKKEYYSHEKREIYEILKDED